MYEQNTNLYFLEFILFKFSYINIYTKFVFLEADFILMITGHFTYNYLRSTPVKDNQSCYETCGSLFLHDLF